MEYTQQEINNFYSKYSCCFASLATDYINSLAIGAFDCGQKLDKLLQFKNYLEILACYKVDTCIINQPEVESTSSSWYFGIGNFSGTITYYMVIDGVETFLGSGTSVSTIVDDINNNTDASGATAVLGEDGYFTIYSPLGCFVKADLHGIKSPSGTIPASQVVFNKGRCAKEENCEQYTEEQLNCISNEELDNILFWLKQTCLNIKNKPTISELECINLDEDEYIFQVNQSIVIQAGDSIEVERNGNTYTIINPLPDRTVSITAGSNITVTGTYPNFTISSSGGGSSFTATNGLTESPTNTFKLGGSLIENTTITSNTFLTTFIGAPASKTEGLLNLITTGPGSALSINALKYGIRLSSDAVGIKIDSSSTPILATGTSFSSLVKINTATSTVDTILSLSKSNTGYLASLQNSGVAIAFAPGELPNSSAISGSYIELIYEQPSDVNTETKFRFKPLGAATNTFGYSLETFGSGKLKLPAYGQTPANFTGTAINWLAVTSSGDVIEVNPPSGSNTWGSITGTLSSQTDLQTALNTKESSITAGTTAQYWRGDKSWQTLDKTAIGLSNVDNTSDSTKNSVSATLTNKRITVRTDTITSSATPTINTDNIDYYSITALSTNITSMTTNLSGTPTTGQTLWVAITDNGTARTITWGAKFEASTVALPVKTVISTRLDVAFIWNEVTSKWRCVKVA